MAPSTTAQHATLTSALRASGAGKRQLANLPCAQLDGRAPLAHNIEAGVLLEDAAFSLHLARQWLGLIEAGLVVEASRDEQRGV